MFGDYHAILYDINEEEYELLQKNASIKMMEPSKVIQIENVPLSSSKCGVLSTKPYSV